MTELREGYCPRCHRELTLTLQTTIHGKMWLCHQCAFIQQMRDVGFVAQHCGITFDEVAAALNVMSKGIKKEE